MHILAKIISQARKFSIITECMTFSDLERNSTEFSNSYDSIVVNSHCAKVSQTELGFNYSLKSPLYRPILKEGLGAQMASLGIFGFEIKGRMFWEIMINGRTLQKVVFVKCKFELNDTCEEVEKLDLEDNYSLKVLAFHS